MSLDPTQLTAFNRTYYLQKIEDSSNPQGACRVWNRGGEGGGSYPRMRITIPGRGSHQYRIHQLVYALNNNKKLDTPYFEISHLCHNTQCVNLEHLSYEPHVTNMQRVNCVSTGHCLGGHGTQTEQYRACIL